MLGQIANIDHSAGFKMAVPNVKISMRAINPHAAAPEFAPVESKIVVIELQEGDPAFAIFKQAIFECGLRQRLP